MLALHASKVVLVSTQDVIRRAGLTPEQQAAVSVREKDVLVTAGAGSGKTRTLVTRYLWLLARGVRVRRLLAITFTEKAAREMRNRVRLAIDDLAQSSLEESERDLWLEHSARIDAARIGTIHSFCAELLRSHPAEARVDPKFEVIEEGMAGVFKAQAIEDAINWGSGDEGVAQVFNLLSPRQLSRVLSLLLERRLDVGLGETELDGPDAREALARVALDGFLGREEVVEAIGTLRALRARGELSEDAGEKLGTQIDALLEGWQAVERAMESGFLTEAAADLFKLRREEMALNVGKRDSRAKSSLAEIRAWYTALANPWLGGDSSSDLPPDPDWERNYTRQLSGITDLFRQALNGYLVRLQTRSYLDFDDLESGALELLRLPQIRGRWEQEVSHVLVDEFQDTNARQREIVRALTQSGRGRLFIVGDARQSIYRFRGADVEVFRQAARELDRSGGRHIELALTFRAHEDLLRGIDDLVGPVMGHEADPEELFRVPYSQLRALRDAPRAGCMLPYVEFVLGLGERSPQARKVSAAALAARLLSLKDEGQIQQWDDVVLLFRASTGFADYEEAFERAKIPFVTVAGRGFYDRPEIRDVLNILKAVAEPWNDLALAGLLRSPAIGLRDGALYSLRWVDGRPAALRARLDPPPEYLAAEDQAACLRADEFLSHFEPLADRLPVSELLKRIVDWLDYKAVLAVSQARLWRNLDKLISDAHASEAIQVQAFLDYLLNLREVGAREGEAPVEAEGAVRLMTIHKAKGLEFPFVVLADASRRAPGRGEVAYTSPGLGIVARPDRDDRSPLAYEISKWLDQIKSEAEEDRLLYVAATRAREKWLISGHVTGTPDRPRVDGWTAKLLGAAGVEVQDAMQAPAQGMAMDLPAGTEVGLRAVSEVDLGEAEVSEIVPWPQTRARPLFRELKPAAIEELDEEEARPPRRDWRATGKRRWAPAAAVGGIVHESIRRWSFPGSHGFEQMLDAISFEEGLVDRRQREAAMEIASELLNRFRRHPLWSQIEMAEKRYHEIPYTRPGVHLQAETGRIDLLYLEREVWQVIDFKTDELPDASALKRATAQYRPQLQRYLRAVEALLNSKSRARICFLDYQDEVYLQVIE